MANVPWTELPNADGDKASTSYSAAGLNSTDVNTEALRVFGTDYPTPDGTGLRDYIHVEDLARGHVVSLGKLLATGESHVVNLGTGKPSSVMDMLAAYSRAVGRELPHVIAPRRPGDVPVLVADPAQAERLLGFRAEKTIDEMCASSWAFVSRRRNG